MHVPPVLLALALFTAANPDTPFESAPPSSSAPTTLQGILLPDDLKEMLAPPSALEPPTVAEAPAHPWPAKMIWGAIDGKAFPDAGRVAPNGVSYNPLFSLDLNLNIWLWPRERIYLFADSRYWGGRGGEAGQTHGNIDYTRREFDFGPGIAWNYYGLLEVRLTSFAHENFNRGTSMVTPGGTTNDGAGVEQRLYLSDEYLNLGEDGFNVSRATFVSVGYYAGKGLVGADGAQFKPGLFAHAYLTWDVPSICSYLYLDLLLTCDQTGCPRRLDSEIGLAMTPFEAMRLLEFRVGSEFNTGFTSGGVRNMSLPYLSVRLNY
jgi:hypothetical protein